MQNTKPIFLLILSLIFLNACSSDSSEETEFINVYPALSITAENINGTAYNFNCSVTQSDVTITDRGICWSTTNMIPNIEDSAWNHVTEQANEAGDFTISNNTFSPGSIYFVSSFVKDNHGNFYYSTPIFITIPGNLVTIDPIDITTTTAVLQGHLTQGSNVTANVGFIVYRSRFQVLQPTQEHIVATVQGADTFTVTCDNLTPKDPFYVRAIQKLEDGTFIYGEVKEFRTCGYEGPAGGTVAYDKGVTTDGWRYLEASGSRLDYSNSVNGAQWSENYNSLPVTETMGAGLQNSEIINNSSPGQNCAAKLCLNFTQNGHDDWFLGSADEMLIAMRSLLKLEFDGYNPNYWTSSQDPQNSGKGIFVQFDGYFGYVKRFDDKDEKHIVRPIRKY